MEEESDENSLNQNQIKLKEIFENAKKNNPQKSDHGSDYVYYSEKKYSIQGSEQNKYHLVVSEDSSDQSLNLSEHLVEDEVNQTQQKESERIKEENEEKKEIQSKAVQNMKNIFRQSIMKSKDFLKQNSSSSQNGTPKLIKFVSQQKHNDVIRSDKKQITFLKGLQQNQDLNSSLVKIDEYYEDGKIHVKIKCKEFMTFMRLQHEAEELKRKQNDFNEQKERHFHMTRGNYAQIQVEKIVEAQKAERQNRYNKNWIVGLMLAKRFLRQARRSSTVNDRLIALRKQDSIIQEVQDNSIRIRKQPSVNIIKQ